MFDNIDQKIKTLAKVITILGCALAILIGINLIAYKNLSTAIAVIAGGCLLSWVGSFVLYGFGEIISKLNAITELEKDTNKIIKIIYKDLPENNNVVDKDTIV